MRESDPSGVGTSYARLTALGATGFNSVLWSGKGAPPSRHRNGPLFVILRAEAKLGLCALADDPTVEVNVSPRAVADLLIAEARGQEELEEKPLLRICCHEEGIQLAGRVGLGFRLVIGGDILRPRRTRMYKRT